MAIAIFTFILLLIVLGIIVIDKFLIECDDIQCKICGSLNFEYITLTKVRCERCGQEVQVKEVLLGNSKRDNSCS